MPRNWGYLLLTLLIFSACTAPTESFSVPETSTMISTALPALTSTTTATRQFSTRTPRPSQTPTVVPSVTPTFDIAAIVTRTPAPPENCPTPANVPLPDLASDSRDLFMSFLLREEDVLDYLNQGGSPSRLIVELGQTLPRAELLTDNEVIRDLTGDGVPELLIIPLSNLYIWGCQNNQYQLLMSKTSEYVTINFYQLQLVGIQDMNLNSIPEVVVADFGCGWMSEGQCLDVYAYEWNGTQFASLIQGDSFMGAASIYGGSLDKYFPGAEINDIDGNGTLELTLSGGIPNTWYDDYFWHAPWRTQSDTYGWNGEHFVFVKTEFSSPIYRYQAVQDGDRALLRHDYPKALAFYQEAIFSDTLLGWSPAHKERSIALHELTWNFALKGTPTPAIPSDDLQEYPNLAAYARYRIMLLHILQGNVPEAQIVYQTLQEKFPEGSDGHGFALVAKAFWDHYQLSKNIKASCAKAVSVAYEVEAILRFLGADYHNSWQDILYESKDVCPFE